VHPQIEAAISDAVIRQRTSDGLHVIDPAAAALLVCQAVMIVAGLEAEGAHPIVFAGRQLDERALGRGDRQDRAAVVVEVFADQVDAAGCAHANGRRSAEAGGEGLIHDGTSLPSKR
jgi:hypothetical protein